MSESFLKRLLCCLRDDNQFECSKHPIPYMKRASSAPAGNLIPKRIKRQRSMLTTASFEGSTDLRKMTLRKKFSQVFKRKIVDENSPPTIEQQRGLDAYESLIRENPDGPIGTLLHFAVARSDDQLLEYALDHGLRQHGNINQQDPIGRLPIDVAIHKEHVPCIEKLVTHGADVDLTSFFKSLARRNRVSTIGRILRCKNLESHMSMSVLLAMFETTLSSGSVEATKVIIGSERFHRAVIAGGEGYLQSLAGALLLGDISAWQTQRNDLEFVLDHLLMLGLDLDRRWPTGSATQESWLHALVEKPSIPPMRALLDRGANCDVLDSGSQTPLMRAIARAEAREEELTDLDEIIKAVDILLCYNATLDAGKGVWSMKASSGFWVFFEKLVVAAPYINHVDERGLTLLHYAVDESNQADLDLLLPKCSLILNYCSLVHGTALSVACRRQDWDIANKLVKAGAQCSYDDLKAMLSAPKLQQPQLLETLKFTPFLSQEHSTTPEEVRLWLSLLTQDVLSDCTQASDLQTLDQLSRWLPAWLKNGQDVAAVLTMRVGFIRPELQVEACKIFLRNGTNPNAYTTGPKPLTLIEYAVKHLLFDCAIALLEAGADPNQSRCSKTLVLDRALKLAARGPLEARWSAADFAHKLRQWGAKQERPDPTSASQMVLPIHQLSPASSTTSHSSQNTHLVGPRQLTLTPESPGADIIHQSNLGYNALHRAIRAGDPQAVYTALSGGVDPNVPTPVTNEYPVVMALNEDSSAILSILLSRYFQHIHPTPNPNGTISESTGSVNPRGADHPDLSWTGGYTDLMIARCLPRGSITYLMAAAMKGSIACVRALLEAGANVNVRDEGYRTALHHVLARQPRGYLEIAEVMTRYGADVFAEEGVHYYTPLHMAVHCRDKRLLEALLTSNAFATDYGHRSRDTRPFTCGMSPRDLAVTQKFSEGVMLFDRAWELARVGRW